MSDGRAGGTAVPFLNGFVSKIAKQFEILMWARYPEQFSQTARSTLVKLLRWLARLPMVLGVSNAAAEEAPFRHIKLERRYLMTKRRR
jgi:hypothetical protein